VEEWRHVGLDRWAADSREAEENCRIAGSKTMPLPEVQGDLNILVRCVEDRVVLESQ